MATIGYFCNDSISSGNLFFKVTSEDNVSGFYVTAFMFGIPRGMAEVRSLPNTDIDDILSIVMGCFQEGSNFKEELFKVYNCNETTEFKKIRLVHEGVTLFVSAVTTDKNELLAEYSKELEEIEKRRQDYFASLPSVNELCW